MKGSKLLAWAQGSDFKLYCSRTLTSWGDRMWQFALGLYLVKLDGSSLRLAAIFGFLSSASIIMFGGLIGHWVDSNNRLHAIKVSLVSQNIGVAVCSTTLCFLLNYEETFSPSSYALLLAQIAVIAIGIFARLASLACGLIVEKDWVIEYADRNPIKLAKLNAMLRRIDLTCLVASPAIVGQIMTRTSLITAAIFLAIWNVCSVFCEGYLLWKIYWSTPQLQVDKGDARKQDAKIHENAIGNEPPTTDDCGSRSNDIHMDAIKDVKSKELESGITCNSDLSLGNENFGYEDDENKHDGCVIVNQQHVDEINSGKSRNVGVIDGCDKNLNEIEVGETKSEQIVNKIDEKIVGDWQESGGSEKCDKSNIGEVHRVDSEMDGVPNVPDSNETINKLNADEDTKSATKSCCFKIWRTLRSWIVSFKLSWVLYFKQSVFMAGLGLSCLYMTVLGFDSITVGYGYIQGISESFMGWMSMLSGIFGITGTLVYPVLHRKLGLKGTGIIGLTILVLTLTLCVGSIWAPGSPFDIKALFEDYNNDKKEGKMMNGKYESIGIFLAGIIAARFGLWISDLTITQLFQENVEERLRGKVNGVQKSLEAGMDLLKFLLVIAVPGIETFGLLIIISFIFIFFGWLSFSVYAREVWFTLLKKCGCNDLNCKKKTPKQQNEASR